MIHEPSPCFSPVAFLKESCHYPSSGLMHISYAFSPETWLLLLANVFTFFFSETGSHRVQASLQFTINKEIKMVNGMDQTSSGVYKILSRGTQKQVWASKNLSELEQSKFSLYTQEKEKNREWSRDARVSESCGIPIKYIKRYMMIADSGQEEMK